MALSKIRNDSLADTAVHGRRNLIINGAMQVSQRGTSFSFAHDGTYLAYTIDRFRLSLSNLDQYDCTVTQDSDAPAGFSNSLKIATGTAETTIQDTELVYFTTKLEAQNLQHLEYGSSSAKKVTLSFWVKSSVTGTYALSFYKEDSTNRVTARTYTIDAADTWEYKTVTVDGDTDSGATIANDNGAGIWVAWNLAAGGNYNSTDSSDWIDYANAGWAYGHAENGVITTASATWQLTGVQLEVGDIATPFEHRSYAEELNLARRYYIERFTSTADQYGNIWTGDTSADTYYHSHPLPVDMRANPTVTATSAAKSSGFGTLIVSNGSKQSVTVRSAHTGTGQRAYFYWGFKADAEL